MTHYICTGTCEGVSNHPGTCGAEDCPKHNKQFESCDCLDGKHDGRQDYDEKSHEPVKI